MSKHKYPKKQIKKITLFVYLSLILILLLNYYKLQLIEHKEYKKKALVILCTHSKNHFGTAFELFYKNGPLAILPFSKNVRRLGI